tara:strand:- start:27781 stop:29286 length:1506 start_codon:yes stop_codon:yes gene_type:complete
VDGGQGVRRDKRSKEKLNSDTHLNFINVFIPSQVEFLCQDDTTTANFSRLRYQDQSITPLPIEDGVIRKFPIIYRGDGTPWDLGNLYLMYRFTEEAKYKPPSIDTLKAVAKHLTMFLRWIEHVKYKGGVTHELYFPEAPYERVTYRYRRYLLRLLKQNPQPIKLGVAKARMAAVVNFYKGLIKGDLVAKTDIDNPPFEIHIAGIPILNAIGLQYIKQVEVSDLTIHKPKREVTADVIMDGGNLRPLTEGEQKAILDGLWTYGNRAFQLMVWVALFTGARIQTVCTLRICDIKTLLESSPDDDELLLKVGKGTGVDTKNQKKYQLHFPRGLVEQLRCYMVSEERRERSARSFYRESDKNYLFLAENGSPFYTSTAEIADRQKGEFSKRISPRDRVEFTIQNGNSIRNYITRLIRQIRLTDPNFKKFRFHDLRASFGMNFVRDADAHGIKDIRDQLKVRMGHSNFNTTKMYLEYDSDNERVTTAMQFHHDRLNRAINGVTDDY